MGLKLGHFVKCIRNSWKVLKCGAGQGWRRSVGQMVLEMWCWTGMEEISWTDGVRNVVLDRDGGDQLDRWC